MRDILVLVACWLLLLLGSISNVLAQLLCWAALKLTAWAIELSRQHTIGFIERREQERQEGFY